MRHAKTLVDDLIASYACPTDLDGQRIALVILRAWHLAIETGDLEALRAMMHEDIVIELPFSESGRTDPGFYRVYEGIAACVEFWKVAMSFEAGYHPFSDMDLTVAPDGSRIFVEARGHVTMRSGVDYRNRYVLRLDVLDGKVGRYREYYNPIISAHAFDRPIAGQFKLAKL